MLKTFYLLFLFCFVRFIKLSQISVLEELLCVFLLWGRNFLLPRGMAMPSMHVKANVFG
jgi:hypothetical protein